MSFFYIARLHYGTKTKWASLNIVGTGTLNINTAGDATHTVSYDSATGKGTVTISISGSATAKPDIKEGGTTVVGNAGHINFDNTDFNAAVDGLGAALVLSVERKGTTTATVGYNAMYGTSSNAFVQSGIICMWAGSVASIPSGWQLCNGTNGTPDLRDRFIMGAGSTYNPGDTGGISTHTHTENAHMHLVDPPNTTTTGSNYAASVTPGLSGAAWDHTHNVNIASFDSSYGSSTINNTTTLPPYYALCYIMKL